MTQDPRVTLPHFAPFAQAEPFPVQALTDILWRLAHYGRASEHAYTHGWYEAAVSDSPYKPPRIATILADHFASVSEQCELLEVRRPSAELRVASLPYSQLVSARRFSPLWPPRLKTAYRACLAAYLAWRLGHEAVDSERDYRELSESGELVSLYHAWHTLEARYAPRFAEWEAQGQPKSEPKAAAEKAAQDGE